MLLENFQAQQALKYDVKKSYSCKEYGCIDGVSCHCCHIYEKRVTFVDIPMLVKMIWKFYNPQEDKKMSNRDNVISSIFYGGKDTDEYCIDRIIRKFGVYKFDVWDIEVINGYYGDEVNSIKLNKELARKLDRHMSRLMNFDTLKEKLEYCLMVEYGKVLDILCDKDYDLIRIKFNEIEFSSSNELHINMVSHEDISHYSPLRYGLPRGIVKKIGLKYYILDGFHRILALKEFCLESKEQYIELNVYSVVG